FGGGTLAGAYKKRWHVVGRDDVTPAAGGRQRDITVAGGDIENLLSRADIERFAKLLSNNLQRRADNGVVAGGPDALLTGLQGGEVGLCGFLRLAGGECRCRHGCLSPLERYICGGIYCRRDEESRFPLRRTSCSAALRAKIKSASWGLAW